MANVYCTIEQLGLFLDIRVGYPVTQDGDSTAQAETRQQAILDMQAAYMESLLGGLYALPVIDTVTNLPSLVCTRFVATTTVAVLLSRRLAEFPAVAAMYRESNNWLEAVSKYRASIPNVNRLATAHPALVSSGNMTGAPSQETLLFMDGYPWAGDANQLSSGATVGGGIGS